MELSVLLDDLFPEGHQVDIVDGALWGAGQFGGREVAIIGTTDHAAIGVEIALKLAGIVLETVRNHPGRPILMLVDTQGQRMSRRDEMLGINGYLAHLAKCLEVARRRGHRLVTLVYANAVSGGFLSFGLMGDEIHTLEGAQVRVMNLPAMARITKLPLERLEELSRTSAVFAPGVENFIKLGGVSSVWRSPLAAELSRALERTSQEDLRRREGLERGGRELAWSVAQRAAEEPAAAVGG